MTTYETKDRIAIDREVLDWIKESPWRDDETRFNALAKRIFHYQFENCKPYARFATGRFHSTPRQRNAHHAVARVLTQGLSQKGPTASIMAPCKVCDLRNCTLREL